MTGETLEHKRAHFNLKEKVTCREEFLSELVKLDSQTYNKQGL